eukprot:Gb_02532 [translate_table: standard]
MENYDEKHLNHSASHGSAFNHFNGKLAVISLLLLVVQILLLVFCAHICAKRFRGRTPSRPGRRSRSLFSFRQYSFAVADVERALPGYYDNGNVGLGKEMIESLPIFIYQSECYQDGLDCAVCLCEFEENEKGRLLPRCNHSFHVECIEMWLHSHSTCPLCRTNANSKCNQSFNKSVTGSEEVHSMIQC